jgi:hypothetical protein
MNRPSRSSYNKLFTSLPIIGLMIANLPSSAQSTNIHLKSFGYEVKRDKQGFAPSYSGISYIGRDSLFITFRDAARSESEYGKPFSYNAIVLSRSGELKTRALLSGVTEDQLQLRIPTQPLANILVVSSNELLIYDETLSTYKAISLPERPQLRLSTDRKTVVIISQDGNEASETVISLADLRSRSQHLAFDERAVRDAQLAVSNGGAVAHSVRDPGAELSVAGSGVHWPKQFDVGKYQTPLAFLSENSLLVSAMATTPFPPTHLYVWHPDGTAQQIGHTDSGSYTNAQVSTDGKRIFVKQTDNNFFRGMLGDFDCGGCGETYSYSVVDIPAMKAILKRPHRWNCEQAFSPDGSEIAELCDGVIRFIAIAH